MSHYNQPMGEGRCNLSWENAVLSWERWENGSDFSAAGTEWRIWTINEAAGMVWEGWVN